MHGTVSHKEKKRKKIISSVNKTTRAPSGKGENKFEESNTDDTQVGMDVQMSCFYKNPTSCDKFNENQDYDPELHVLQGKVAELARQRDNMARHLHILSEANESNHLNNINSDSLLSEICRLKSIVGIIQKGLLKVLDEHTVMKSILIDKIKDINYLLDRNFKQENSKDRHNPRDCTGKYVYPKCKQNNGVMLSKCSNSNQSLHYIWKASSFMKCSNSNLFETISRISNIFDSGKNDSLAKFRRVAELKIIIEILQKYSKIVTDEFEKYHNDMENYNQNILDLKFKTNTIIENQAQDEILSGSENSLDSSYCAHSSIARDKIEINKNDLRSPQLITIFDNTKITKHDVQLEVSSNSFQKHLKNLCKKIVFKKENYWNVKKDGCSVNKPLNIFYERDKELKKKNVLFLADCHGRFCSHLLQKELGPSFSVVSVIKPDALFQEIVKDFQHLASTFSHEDYVIIFAGSNNMKLKNKKEGHINFEIVLPILKHTNIVFTMIPLLFDKPSLNPQIRTVNSDSFKKIYALATKNSNILLMPKFSFFSREHPHRNFNKIGKKTLCKLLANTILTHAFEKNQKYLYNSQSPCTPPNTPESSHWLSDANKNKTELENSVSLKQDNRSKVNTFVITQRTNACEPFESNNKTRKCAQTQTIVENQTEHIHPEVKENFFGCKSFNQNKSTEKNSAEKDKYCTETTRQQVGSLHGNRHSEDDSHQQGFFAGIFMKNNQTNMTTIKELLGQGDIPKPRKNFIQENVKRLKELKLEKTNKLSSQRGRNQVLQPLTERRNAQTMVSSSRFSQRGTSVRSTNQSPPPRSQRTIKHVTIDTQSPIVEVEDNPRGYRSQGCQTLSSKQLEHLYDEGVIRYASARDVASCSEGDTRIVREMGLQTEMPLEVLHPPPPSSPPSPSDEGLHWDEEKKGGDKDYVKMNATVPDPRRHKTPDPNSSDPNRAPPNYQRGKVPKYLREHKKEMERERKSKVREDECPEGHVQLPEDIKQNHLTTLRQNYAELVSQLNQLPVSTDTLRTRTRKKQIEADLDRIESAIALFSREKVFVKADS